MRKDILRASRSYRKRVQRFMSEKRFLAYPKVKKGVK